MAPIAQAYAAADHHHDTADPDPGNQRIEINSRVPAAAFVRVLVADDDVEIGDPGGVDRGFGGGLILDRIQALLGEQTRHLPAPLGDDELTPLRGVVGALMLADVEECEIVTPNRDGIAPVHELDRLFLPGLRSNDAGEDEADAGVGEGHAVGPSRQVAGPFPRFGQGQAEKLQPPGETHERAGDEPRRDPDPQGRQGRGAGGQRPGRDRHRRGGGEGQLEAAENTGQVGAFPRHHRTDRGQYQKRHDQGTEGPVEIGGPDGNLVPAESVEEEGIHGAEKDRGARRRQQEIVDHQAAFPRYRGEQTAPFHGRGADRVEDQGSANHEDQEGEDENAARRIGGEGMNRGKDSRADQEGPQQREGKGQDGEQDRPTLQGVAPFANDGRMQKRRAREPGHEGGVLDRIPEPEAAPAELVIGPPAAHGDADREEAPGGERPGPDPAGPGGVDPAFEQGRDGEREGHRKAHVTEIEEGRVISQPRVLKQGIQIAAVDRRRVQPFEGIGGKHRKCQETYGDQGLDGKDAGPQGRRQIGPEEADRQAIDREDQDPQQERALVIAPHTRDLVHQRLRRVGILGHVGDAEVGHHVGVHEAAKSDRDEEKLGHARGPGQGHPVGVAAPGADQRQGSLGHGDEERQDQGVMSDFGNQFASPSFQ